MALPARVFVVDNIWRFTSTTKQLSVRPKLTDRMHSPTTVISLTVIRNLQVSLTVTPVYVSASEGSYRLQQTPFRVSDPQHILYLLNSERTS